MVPSRLIVSTEGKNYLRIRRRKDQAKTFGEFFVVVVLLYPLISSLKGSYDAFFFYHYFVYLVYKNMLACFNI